MIDIKKIVIYYVCVSWDLVIQSWSKCSTRNKTKIEWASGGKIDLHFLFTNFKQAFDRVNREKDEVLKGVG